MSYKAIRASHASFKIYTGFVKYYNGVVKRKALGTVIVEGKELIISVATETRNWRRPEFIVHKLKTPLQRSIESWPERIPPWATEVCARESNHESPNDPTIHITAVAIGIENDET
ncbi:hypothetical protein F5884DRAFT_180158 [Xylogone sp. PMI_703]|nr:hypothetical protein F5884DRAFT_180158 [Xylogone sp. PMI_703]